MSRGNLVRSVVLAALAASVPCLQSAPVPDRAAAAKELTSKAAAQTSPDLGIGRMIRDLKFQPLHGEAFQLSSLSDARAVAILFTSSTCPISKKYGSSLAALEKKFAAEGVRFILVNPIASDKTTEMEEFIAAHGLKSPYVHDVSGAISKALSARSTAEAFVLDAHRTLLYRGAVDDQYGVGFSKETAAASYLADALQQALANKKVDVAATTAPGCILETDGAPLNADLPVTYHAQVSRILQQHCLECHREGGVAPFSLGSYSDVRSHAGMIRKMVEGGLMPPWFAKAPEPGHSSPWANDRSLNERDRNDLLAWIAGDKAEGDPKDAPAPIVYPADWQIGSPDMVVQLPEPIQVQATGRMPYQDVYVPTGLTEDKWVSSLEVRPTALDVVHHVLVFAQKEMPEAGKKRRGDNDLGNFLAVYVPGNNRLEYPAGFAKHLPAGSVLHFQIHYTPKGTATNDQTRLGLIFSKETVKHEVRVAAIANTWFKIPPGNDNYEVKGVLPVLFKSKILALMPHMHLRGKAFKYELARADGSKTTLLEVPRYDFNWQLQYRLKEPLEVEPGSRLLATGWFNNSDSNPSNPDPTRQVKWGPQTDDEMMLGYLEFYIPDLLPGQAVTPAKVAEKAKIMFETLDKNEDGVITREEAPTGKAFTEADINGNGEVTRAEFEEFASKKARRASQ
jgi:hypothetical protein